MGYENECPPSIGEHCIDKLTELTVKELFMVDRRKISSLRLIALILRVDHHLEITIKLSTLGTQCSLKACVLN